MTSKINGFKAFCNKTGSSVANPIHANETTEPNQTPSTPPTDKPTSNEPKPK